LKTEMNNLKFQEFNMSTLVNILKGILICIFILIFSGIIESANGEVLLYQKLEESMVNEEIFSNPFTDTELRLHVSAPSGRQLGSSFTFFGFHDGDGQGGQDGNVWKFRLLFDYPGTWEIQAGFFEPGTDVRNGPHQTFIYNVSNVKISPGEHGHVRIDPEHPRWFRFDDGTQWYPNPTVAHSYLYSPFYSRYVDEHLSRGIDVLGVGFRLGNTSFDRYAPAPPWLYSSPAGSGGTPDFTRFDVANWRYIEERLNYAQTNGMKLYIWFGISGLNSQYDQPGPGPISNPNTKLYVNYFLSRWAAYTSWWYWTIDSEYEENGEGVGNLGDQTAYADYIREQNPWNTLISTHTLENWTPENNPSLDLATLQMHPPENPSNFIPSNYYIKPVFNAEGIWFEYFYDKFGELDPSDYVRLRSWEHFMAGGHSAYTDSIADWWGDWDKTCYEEYGDQCPAWWDPMIHHDSVSARGNQSQIIANYNFNQTEPANTLVTIIEGNNIYCLADPGNLYLIWMDEGGTPTVDLSDQPAIYSVQLYNTADGTSTDLPIIYGDPSVTLQSTPSYGLGHDWLYVLKSLPQCEGDSEPDGDVDGSDLVQEINAGGSDVDQVASNFGKAECTGIY